MKETETITQEAMQHAFPKPLSMNDRLTIELLTARYEGVDDVFAAFDTPDAVVLRVPRIIRPTFMRAES